MIGYFEITAEDLKEQNLAKLNGLLRQVVEEVNRLGGSYGPVVLTSDLDMGGHRVLNLAAPQGDSDAVSKGAGDERYVSGASLSKTLEATGSQILQTTRRLNDRTQQERYSSHMNRTGPSLAQANNSTITVVPAGVNSTITLAAGTGQYGDDEKYSYGQRVDTVANPGAGSDYYYYYWDVVQRAVRFIGPFTMDNSFNRLVGNRDGRSYLGVAKVNAGGGGTGGGGGDGPGCCEIGTKITIPAGSVAEATVEPCSQWVDMELEDGRTLSVALRTLVSVFFQAEDLVPGQLVEVEDGRFLRLIRAQCVTRESYKIPVRVRPGQTYLGNGYRLHNLKP
jgi:hypothetical protein